MNSRVTAELQGFFDGIFDAAGGETFRNWNWLPPAGGDAISSARPTEVSPADVADAPWPDSSDTTIAAPAALAEHDLLQISQADVAAQEDNGAAIKAILPEAVAFIFPELATLISAPAAPLLPAGWFVPPPNPTPDAAVGHGGALGASAQTGFQVVLAGLEAASATAAHTFDSLTSLSVPAPVSLVDLANPAPGSVVPVTNSAVGSGGATAAQVQQALNETGVSVTGAGIKVGVISDSFNNLGGAAADEADGALPSAANIQVLKDDPSGGTDEGRAMMEIIHEIAPNASLAFYTADVSEQDFANGILALAASGCTVICDDVSYYDEPFFQNGVVAQAIQTVEAEGVTYITAAGNDASNAYQASWTPISGTFDGTKLTDSESFNGSLVQTITLTASKTQDSPLLVEWNQPYGQATADLELLVFRNGKLVGTATNRTSGESTNPWIYYDFTASGTYQIAIENLSGPNPTLIKEISQADGLAVTISGANAGSVYGHAMTPGAITAGAVSTAATPYFSGTTPVSESFSSSGSGTELLFANNGTPLSSPDVLSPVAVSGIDDIKTTVSGGLADFYGTSAASASLAGVAALLLSANPNLTPAQVEQIMEQTATPMTNSAVSGAGLVNVSAAVAAAQALEGTVIEAFGSTELVQNGSNYYFEPVGGGTAVELKNGGVAVVAGQYGGSWAPIGVEATSSGYEVAWKVTGSDQYTVWNTDSSGNFISEPIGGSVSGSNAALISLESSFHQDLNGDGVISTPSSTVIEALGSTELIQNGSNYYFEPVGGGTAVELKNGGAPVVAGQYGGGWAPIGVEATSSGYEVAWKVTGSDQYTIWNTDSSGNFTSEPIGGSVSGSNTALISLESSFHQDLNGDGVIGTPSSTVIEALGSTELVQNGSNYYFEPIGGGTAVELENGGAPVVAGQYGGGWAPIGVEATSSGYEVAWKVTGSDQYTIWNTDSSGNFTSEPIGGSVSGSSTALESLEPSFHQDLNGDGSVGIPSSPTTNGVASQSSFISWGANNDTFEFSALPELGLTAGRDVAEQLELTERFQPAGQNWAAMDGGAATQPHQLLPWSYGAPDALGDLRNASGHDVEIAGFHPADPHLHSFIIG